MSAAPNFLFEDDTFVDNFIEPLRKAISSSNFLKMNTSLDDRLHNLSLLFTIRYCFLDAVDPKSTMSAKRDKIDCGGQ